MYQQENLESDFYFSNNENMVHVVCKKNQSHYKVGFGLIDWK